VGGQRLLLPAPPAARAVRRAPAGAVRGCRAVPDLPPEDRLPGRAGRRGDLAGELAVVQPDDAEEGAGDRRAQPAARRAQRPARHRRLGRDAAADDAGRVRGGPGPGRHARLGGVPQPARRAHPVRAADRARARDPAAALAAVDQQVLHHGPRPGEEPRRVGGAARAHRVRAVLPRPGREPARRDDERLPARGPARRARRRAGDHRRGEGQRRGAVPPPPPRGSPPAATTGSTRSR
jgi:hypothetical protein